MVDVKAGDGLCGEGFGEGGEGCGGRVGEGPADVAVPEEEGAFAGAGDGEAGDGLAVFQKEGAGLEEVSGAWRGELLPGGAREDCGKPGGCAVDINSGAEGGITEFAVFAALFVDEAEGFSFRGEKATVDGGDCAL